MFYVVLNNALNLIRYNIMFNAYLIAKVVKIESEQLLYEGKINRVNG